MATIADAFLGLGLIDINAFSGYEAEKRRYLVFNTLSRVIISCPSWTPLLRWVFLIISEPGFMA